MSFTSLLISLADVYRRVDASADGMGPSSNSGLYTQLVASAVPCRVAQQGARARFKAKTDGKDAIVDTLTIFTDYRTDIQARDRFIVVADPVGAPGVQTFYDTDDMNDPGLMHHHLEFVAKKVS